MTHKLCGFLFLVHGVWGSGDGVDFMTSAGPGFR